jgi:hypothetical protein
MVVALVTSVIGIWAVARSRHDPTPLSSLSVVFAPSERIREWGPDTALSPDGSTLVYTAESGQLNVRRIDQLTARAVPGTGGSGGPFLSPDGRWIGFNRIGQLMKMAVEGGAPVPLGVTAAFLGTADWGGDDHIVYASRCPGSHPHTLPQSSGGPQRLNVIQGWKAAILRRLDDNR